jgi:hypothetical protein
MYSKEYNKIVCINVLTIVMKTADKNKSLFEGKSNYRNRLYYSKFDRISKSLRNQDFVVPWQMLNTEEKSYLVR